MARMSMAQATAKVTSMLAAQPAPVWPKAIAEATGLSKSYVDDILSALLNRWQVERLKNGYRLRKSRP